MDTGDRGGHRVARRDVLTLPPGRDPQVRDGHDDPQGGAEQDRQQREKAPCPGRPGVRFMLRPQRPGSLAITGGPGQRKGQSGPCPQRAPGHGPERDQQKDPAGLAARIGAEKPPGGPGIRCGQPGQRDVHEDMVNGTESAPVRLPVLDHSAGCQRADTEIDEHHKGEAEHGDDLCPAQRRPAERGPEHDAEHGDRRECQPDEMPRAPLALLDDGSAAGLRASG